MTRSRTIWRSLVGAGLTVMLAAALGSSALAAKKAKKQKEQAVPTGQKIPAHPTELQYGPLNFEVPEGARYRNELSNGIVVYVAEDHALPLVSVTITLRAGSFLDPAHKPGLAA